MVGSRGYGINSSTIAKNIAFPPFEEWESIN